MNATDPDHELLARLVDIPEISACGFAVREGLSGRGVTVLKGNSYFGSWRFADGAFIWLNADLALPAEVEPTVDDALRYTLLLILRNLESKPGRQRTTRLAS